MATEPVDVFCNWNQVKTKLGNIIQCEICGIMKFVRLSSASVVTFTCQYNSAAVFTDS